MPATTPSLRNESSRRSAAEPDGICAAAVTSARQAAEAVAEAAAVGEHLSADADGDRVVTHRFACRSRGYLGWHWAVTVARAPRARHATVSEVALLPGPQSVLAPAWVPWSERIAPGDLGATDALPYREDDPYLEPGWASVGRPAAIEDAVEDEDRLQSWELGLGRARVLSPAGREAAATRWYRGDRGPGADEAISAGAPCATCGYFLAVSGSLRQVFGVCANEWSPSDGRVVSLDHGCGAHSETDLERVEAQPLPEPILDETAPELLVIERRGVPEAVPESVTVPDDVTVPEPATVPEVETEPDR